MATMVELHKPGSVPAYYTAPSSTQVSFRGPIWPGMMGTISYTGTATARRTYPLFGILNPSAPSNRISSLGRA